MIKLDNKNIPDFVKVNSIDFSILPVINNNLLKVRGKAGVYNFGQDVGTREIKVSITIVADAVNGVMSASRELAEWLYHKEAVKLEIADEPDKYYLVLPDGDTNITEIANYGQGEITFVCVEPFAFGEEKTYEFEITTGEELSEVFVEGTVETHPILEVTVQEDITSLTIISEDDAIILGEPADNTQQVVNPTPLILTDRMTSLTGWERGYQVDNGIVAGEFEVGGGEYFRVKGNDFGTSSNWHGASAIKKLNKPIKDFRVHFGFELDSTASPRHVGRVELYLLDENDVQFGKIALVDNYGSATKSKFEARAGSWTGGTYFASGQSLPEWDDYYGRILLTREGRQWKVTISPDVNGPYIREYEKSWFDAEGTWDNYKLAKVQIHIGIWGNYPPALMKIHHLQVVECLTLTDEQAPIIAIKDDVIRVDNSQMLVFLNGEPRFDLINPASNFLTFKKGINRISLAPTKANLKVTYPERWL